MDKKTKKILETIATAILDKKGRNVVTLDVKGLSSLTDYIVVAEGNVDRHVIALAKTVEEEMDKIHERPVYIEGMAYGDWIVLDYCNVMVHLFMPGLREKYQIEKLWKEAKIVPLDATASELQSITEQNSTEKKEGRFKFLNN